MTRTVPASDRASRESWLIAMLAFEQKTLDSPYVGDWGVEVSHLVGLGRRKIALDCAIGRVLKIEDGDTFTILTRDGVEQKWENAMFRKIPNPEPTP